MIVLNLTYKTSLSLLYAAVLFLLVTHNKMDYIFDEIGVNKQYNNEINTSIKSNV